MYFRVKYGKLYGLLVLKLNCQSEISLEDKLYLITFKCRMKETKISYNPTTQMTLILILEKVYCCPILF